MNESQTSAALKSSQQTLIYQPGSTVRVTQQIAHRTHVYPITVKGKVISQERQASGSWFARNRGDRLWLDRLIIEKEDGEKVVLNLDEFTSVKVLHGPLPVEGVSPMISPARDRTGSLT